MTTVPIPTFVPQDSWYSLTTGNYNPSVADTVPDITFLRPQSTPQGDVDGIVGPLDGAIIGLAGTAATFDGGQTWLMWDEDSLLPDNGTSVFCPFVDTSTAGRWLALANPTLPVGPVQESQFIPAGQSTVIAASAAPLVYVFVCATRLANIVTTLALPGVTFVGQTFNVKDVLGDAATYNVIVTAPAIDGQPSFQFYANYQGQNFTWNGTEYSAT